MKIDNKKLIEAYGSSPRNWGDLPNFGGNYINFGFWENIQNSSQIIKNSERIQASRALYAQVIERLDIDNETVLEIGCGRGMGIVEALPLKKCQKVWAFDINPDQIVRAKKNALSLPPDQAAKIHFMTGSAEDTGLPSGSVDKVYLIEVTQHFEAIDSFANEMFRVLKEGKQLTMASYCATRKIPKKELEVYIPLKKQSERAENLMPVDSILQKLLSVGFNIVTCEKIGNSVFGNYERWIKQNNAESYDHFKLYQDGLIDYYIITALKCR